MISYLMIYGIVMVIFWEPRLEQVDGLSGCRRCTRFEFVFVLLRSAKDRFLNYVTWQNSITTRLIWVMPGKVF